MQAEELTAEFGIAGILDFVEMETVFVIALKKPDGTVTSARLYAEKDGVKPPM